MRISAALILMALAGACSESLGQNPGEEESSVPLPILKASAAAGDLTAREGQKVVIHGETAGSEKSQSGTNFVNFKGSDFYLVAFKSDLEPFKEGEPAEIFDGKRIVVTGVVTIYQGKPQIKLISPDQVRVLGADEKFPPKAPEEVVEAIAEKSEPLVAATPDVKTGEPEKPRENPPVDWRQFFK